MGQLPPLAWRFLVSLDMLALGIVVSVLGRVQWSVDSLIPIITFVILTWLAELFPIKMQGATRRGDRYIEINVSLPLRIASVIVFLPPVAVLIAFVESLLGEVSGHRPIYIRGFNVSQRVVNVAVCSTVYMLVGGSSNPFASWNSALAVAVTSLLYPSINSALVSIAIGLASRQPPFDVWRSNCSSTILLQIAAAPLGAVVATLWAINWWAVLWLVPVALMLQQTFMFVDRLQRQTTEALMMFVDAIEARDPYSFEHSRRVSEYAKMTARSLHLSPSEVDHIALAAYLHDLGKVGVSDAHLLKPGALTAEERAALNRHVDIGASILAKLSLFAAGSSLVRSHHERYDGKGYPDQLAGEDIPLGARIIAVADAYDAMTSDRPYRPALHPEVALGRVISQKGKQFDPEVVDAFVEALRQHIEEQSLQPRPLLPPAMGAVIEAA